MRRQTSSRRPSGVFAGRSQQVEGGLKRGSMFVASKHTVLACKQTINLKADKRWP